MQTIRKESLRAETPEDGEARKIELPERRTLIATAAITGGAFAAGLVIFYYLRKRRVSMQAR